MKSAKLLVQYVFVLFFVKHVYAAEVDNFTERQSNLPNIAGRVSQLIDQHIELALVAYNTGDRPGLKKSEQGKCKFDLLLKRLEFYLNTNWPKVRDRILSDSVKYSQGVLLTNEGTIYDIDDAKFINGIVGTCCDPLINLQGTLVGVDKVDHFLGHGYLYYLKFKKTSSLKKVLEIGEWQEKTQWGLEASGIKSFGDLAANYSGLFFWQELLDGKDPIIQCEGGRYRRTRNVDISFYVDGAWDEGINCSDYISSRIRKKVEGKIKKVTNGKTCPLEPETCITLRSSAKYPPQVSKSVLHPKCLNVQPRALEK